MVTYLANQNSNMKTLAKWSVEEYHHLIEAGILSNRRVELIAGEIWSMSPEGPLHHSLNWEIADYLRDLLPGVALISEAHPITLADSEPEPDIAVVRSPRSQYRDRHPMAEDIYWLIEISDTTLDYDLGKKKKAYARARISKYWGVDIKNRLIRVFQQPQGEDYRVIQNYREGTITPLAFPHIKIPVEKMLAY
jgi:Uma2 family endonuclease